MAKTSSRPVDTDLVTLAEHILRDSKKLLDQQVELWRTEASQELRRVAGAGLSMAAGGGLAAAGGLMTGVMLVYLLHDVTRLPLWCCYGIVGGTSAVAGMSLLRAGQKDLAEVQLLPRQTTEALEENVTWIKEQVRLDTP